MSEEIVKKLTGKNPKDFEYAAAHIIDNSDVNAFCILVEKSNFLFDFIKHNVAKRLAAAINETNYLNLLSFLAAYCGDYEDVIVDALTKYADEDLTDKMLELLENGSDSQKAYCAKYFSVINDTLAIDLLRKHSYSDFDPLAMNCAVALSEMKDEFSYNQAIQKLDSNDEFEKLSAVRFLVSYNDSKAIENIFKTMKTSSMPENIASEISYLQSFLEFFDTDLKYDTILAVNHIINGLGEIVSLCQIFDFQLYDILERLIELQKDEKSPKIAIVLLNAKIKFEQLTENDEYIFDEDKETKNEIFEIKTLLNSQMELFWNIQKDLVLNELDQWSDFIFPALELVQELNMHQAFDELRSLLSSTNQTIILKTVEVIKSLGKLEKINIEDVLSKITDENIKNVIKALF